MSKVDWINWKTEPKEIMNPDKFIDNVNEKFQEYNCYMNSVVYEGINHELQKGGLGKESLNIFGVSPANEKAVDILKKIDNIKEKIEELKKQVYNESLEQKEIEKSQLIQAIEEKIAEEEKKKSNTSSLREKLTGNVNVVSEKQVNEILEITEERIRQLKNRLEQAKSI